MVIGEGPTPGCVTTVTAETKYSINLFNFTQSGNRFELNYDYNGSNSFLFVNTVKMYYVKAKDSEIKPYLLC